MMSEAKLDRRVQKTQHALQQALIELILEKGYDNVMVQDILIGLIVGRSTFYAHYQDKEDLLASRFERLQTAFEEHAQLILQRGLPIDDRLNADANLPLFILRYIEHDHQLFKALLGQRGSKKYNVHFQGFFLKYTRGILKNHAQAQLLPYQLEVVAQYLTSTFLTLIVWWLDNDLPCSVEDLYKLIMRLMEPGLKDVLEVPSLWA